MVSGTKSKSRRGWRVLAGLPVALVGAAALVIGGLGAGSLEGERDPAMKPVSHENVQSKTIGTWNMQGGSDSVESKWQTAIPRLARRFDILALQEAGPRIPIHAEHQQNLRVNGFEVHFGIIQLDRLHHGYVYFLPVDTGAHRVNLAIITREYVDPDEVVVVPPIQRSVENQQPAPPDDGQIADDGTDNVAQATNRPMLGIPVGDTMYYTMHARASSRGRDAPEMLRRAAGTAQQEGLDWVVLGDFNRSPGSMDRDMPTAQQSPTGLASPIGVIYDSGEATHQSGNNLDYMVTNMVLGGSDDYRGERQPAVGGDHYPEGFGAPLAMTASQFSLESGGHALDVENGTVGLGEADGDIGTMFSPADFDYSDGSAEIVSKRDGKCLANKDGKLAEETCDKDSEDQRFTFGKADSSRPDDVTVINTGNPYQCVGNGLRVQPGNMRFTSCNPRTYWTFKRPDIVNDPGAGVPTPAPGTTTGTGG